MVLLKRETHSVGSRDRQAGECSRLGDRALLRYAVQETDLVNVIVNGIREAAPDIRSR